MAAGATITAAALGKALHHLALDSKLLSDGLIASR